MLFCWEVTRLKRWNLTRFEKGLWFVSTAAILVSFALSGGGNPLTAAVSVLGVTGLLFIAKGYVLGQILIAVFAAIYGGISFFQQYYGFVQWRRMQRRQQTSG